MSKERKKTLTKPKNELQRNNSYSIVHFIRKTQYPRHPLQESSSMSLWGLRTRRLLPVLYVFFFKWVFVKALGSNGKSTFISLCSQIFVRIFYYVTFPKLFLSLYFVSTWHVWTHTSTDILLPTLFEVTVTVNVHLPRTTRLSKSPPCLPCPTVGVEKLCAL